VTIAGNPGRVLVLGSGGPIGTAWTAGLLVGLKRSGVNLAAADRIIGTSAGAIIGAALATGHNLEQFAQLPASADSARRLDRADPAKMQQAFAILATPGLDRAEARRQVGALALTDRDSDAEAAQLASRRRLIASDTWPEHLTIVAVDALSGQPVIWDRNSGVSLVSAVSASSAFPGASPPIQIGGRSYIDGSLRSLTNADLAVGARALLVIAPLAHRVPNEPLRQELRIVGARTAATIAPDAASALTFGSDLYDPASWTPAYQAGHRQSTTIAEEIGEKWTSARHDQSDE